MTGYTLEIFPDKERPPLGETHKEVRIVFDSKEIKAKYIKAEVIFTKDAFNAYLLADSNDKKEAQRALDLKRVAFAKQNSYYPKQTDKFTWVRTDTIVEPPKQYA